MSEVRPVDMIFNKPTPDESARTVDGYPTDANGVRISMLRFSDTYIQGSMSTTYEELTARLKQLWGGNDDQGFEFRNNVQILFGFSDEELSLENLTERLFPNPV